MAQEMNYWTMKNEKAAKAYEHTKEMARRFPKEIAESVEKSVCNFNERFESSSGDFNPDIELMNIDSVSGVFEAFKHGTVAVLNFASFKEPGGMFIQGSMAQEEALCHESDLYNVLNNERFQVKYYGPNHKKLNRALYHNYGIVSPGIIFERDSTLALATVLTVAAPNYSAASRYQGVDRVENACVLRSRQDFVLQLANETKCDTIVLGAFGCGVFGQEAAMVARNWIELIDSRKWNFKNVIFAVIGDKTVVEFDEAINS